MQSRQTHPHQVALIKSHKFTIQLLGLEMIPGCTIANQPMDQAGAVVGWRRVYVVSESEDGKLVRMRCGQAKAQAVY